jgi:predicted GIY-YIG superfamily endonuclease
MTVYLIHFERPLGDLSNPRGQAQHYIGFTEDLAARLDAHRKGNGSAIMAAVGREGIGWRLVRTWEGGRDVERALKDRKNARRLCPICNPWAAMRRGNIAPNRARLGVELRDLLLAELARRDPEDPALAHIGASLRNVPEGAQQMTFTYTREV